MTEKTRAPWTPEQVAALNRFQREGGMHPFTCGAEHATGQSPVLVATNGGWVCPDPQCVYRQDWAHAFMTERSMSITLPPYSGDDATCIKCGDVGARTTYKEFGEPGHGQVGTPDKFPERLERKCNRCDYRWNEALNPPTPDVALTALGRAETELTALRARGNGDAALLPEHLREQLREAIESEVYAYRERTMLWEETGGVTEEIARLAARGAVKALTAHRDYMPMANKDN
ncbi:hypothetical protein F8R89_30885 [Streptomyces sp. SS1-1]|uniref:hypothetical protein n=1 Tax=Streptomyces sp. SS1-1 TaxID=2651869 RepID=UPI0012503132|nr:hypothetical protein [Streptomyces sp. SS1-1]KAB2976015.1 hypothetical protein F8R89_30885 [Streptomyces sp. SS1-1]